MNFRTADLDPRSRAMLEFAEKVTIESHKIDVDAVEYEFDTPAQNMSYNWAPVRDDPYSWWLRVKHVSYNSDSAGISIRFNIFAPQTGTITVTEIP